MPRAVAERSSHLSIELDNPKHAYLAGDVLTGFVVLNSPPSGPYGQVRLVFFGRAKSKVTKSNGQSKKEYRGRALLLEIERAFQFDQCKDKLSEHAWPFSITIPHSPQAAILNAGTCDKWKPAPGFLSTEDDITKHKLPATYYSLAETFMTGTKAEGYVEYVLTATLGASIKCTMPLVLRVKSMDFPFNTSDHKLSKRSTPIDIKTFKLLPEHAGQSLTSKQKFGSVFSRNVPRYAFNIHVCSPTVIQLNHPEPIPLKVWITPILTKDRTTILDPFPEVRLTSLSLYLEARMEARAQTIFSTTETDQRIEYRIVKTQFKNLIIPVPGQLARKDASEHILAFTKKDPDHVTDLEADPPVPLDIENPAPSPTANGRAQHQIPRKPVAQARQSGSSRPGVPQTQSLEDNGQGDNIHPAIPRTTTTAPTAVAQSDVLNLGALLDLRVSRNHSTWKSHPRRVPFERPLWPTFNTYNIRVRYDLRYKIGIECAGETDDQIWNLNYASADCAVLAPSELDMVREEGQWVGKEKGSDLDAPQLVNAAWNIAQLVQGIVSVVG